MKIKQIILLAALSITTLKVSAEVFSGIPSVIDGDTIEIHGNKIRLHGIDAPESSQQCLNNKKESYRCGQQSALFLQQLLYNKNVTCYTTSKDRYGRFIAKCGVSDKDVSALIVMYGWAVAYRRYSSDYVKHEEYAEKMKLNIWSGSFQQPSEFRSSKK